MLNLIKKSISRFIHSGRPKVCIDVAAWARGRGLPVTEIYPPVIGEVEPHLGNDNTEFQLCRESLERPQSLVVIEKAKIRYGVGFLELPDGKICLEGNWKLPLLTENPAYQRKYFFKEQYLKGNWYSLLSYWSPEYYHWFHDVLPRLETALPHLPEDIMFLINETPRSYQLESLKAFGIQESRLLIQPSTVLTSIQHLWSASPLGYTTFGSGSVIRQVAIKLKAWAGSLGDGNSARKFYVSRRKALSRLLVNEDELQDVIKGYGYEIIVPEDTPWIEQVRAFSNARSIIGPHGAGLMNMMFLHPGSSVLEISAQQRTVPCYLVLAGQLMLGFQRLEAEPTCDKSDGSMHLCGIKLSKTLQKYEGQ
jgi:Glycosyltransferase 61